MVDIGEADAVPLGGKMLKIKIDTETFRVISIFERVTRVQPKDCLITDSSIYFLIDKENIGVAIGKNGETAKKISRVLAKEVRLFEYSNDAATLLKNLIPSAESIEIAGSTAKFTIPAKSRYSVIGRAGKNINVVKELMERHCGVTELKFR